MKSKCEILKILRTVVSLLLIACYIAGMICMITFSFKAGVGLWVISTVGGIGLLYCVRNLERRAAEAAESEANRKAMEEGDSDAACE